MLEREKAKQKLKSEEATYRKAANKAGLCAATISNFLEGGTRHDFMTLVKIARLFELNIFKVIYQTYTVDLLVEWAELLPIPKLPMPERPMLAYDSLKNPADLPHAWLVADDGEPSDSRRPDPFWVTATGDTMTGCLGLKRNIAEGDLLFIDPEKLPENGDLVFTKNPNLGISIKRYYIKDDLVSLLPLNDKHPPLFFKPNEFPTAFVVSEIRRKLN